MGRGSDGRGVRGVKGGAKGSSDEDKGNKGEEEEEEGGREGEKERTMDEEVTANLLESVSVSNSLVAFETTSA